MTPLETEEWIHLVKRAVICGILLHEKAWTT